MNSFNEAWKFVCEYCEKKMTSVGYTTWITRLDPISLDLSGCEAKIRVPNNFHKQTIMNCYLNLLEMAFQDIFGKKIKLTFVSAEDQEPEEEVIPLIEGEFTFDNFIVGSSNKFAYAASQSVAHNPAGSYNPLFLYGNSGLGKTHLLFAISNEMKKNNPTLNVLYVKGEEFINELIEAIQNNSTPAFRQKYRYVDVMLIDDIHFIAGKEAVQEEFFHTFNSLHQANKQIVMSSDRAPKEIKTLEDRLRTRFEWGLLADIGPPDYETRIAIIKRKAELLGFSLPNEVTEYIANRLKTNIRQLEGTVKNLQALNSIGERPTITTVQNAISNILNSEQPPEVTVEKIINEVARTYGVSPADIRSAKRSSTISLARQVAMYVIREVTQMSMAAIGEEVGKRDHSTVVYALQQITKLKENDSKLRELIEDIIKNIR